MNELTLIEDESVLVVDQYQSENAALYCADSVEAVRGFRDDTVGLTVTSVPFPGMYVYTNSARDIGNARDIAEMIAQTRYLLGEGGVLRATMPGRLCAIHLSQTMAHKHREGWIGLYDFRGDVIRLMVEEGWIYAGETTIDKDPQVKASRTKEQALLYKTLATDSTKCRMTLADYVVLFRKPGENPVPVRAAVHPTYNPGGGWIQLDEWNEWASPIWHRKRPGIPQGISATYVLNVRQARETDDERHLCPLQLDVIDRLIKLYSAPGDVVYDPFGGIGSTPYVAVGLGRKGAASELKRSYFRSLVQNVQRAETLNRQPTLFDFAASSEAAG